MNYSYNIVYFNSFSILGRIVLGFPWIMDFQVFIDNLLMLIQTCQLYNL